MRIIPVNNQTNFKSSFPVVHWLGETNGSFAPVLELEENKVLQDKLIRILNKSSKMLNVCSPENQDMIRNNVALMDKEYRTYPIARTFNDKTVQDCYNPKPISYILTAEDAEMFNNMFGKNIGKNSKQPLGRKHAVDIYNKEGLRFVNNIERRVKNNNGFTQVLHTTFQIIRDKFGEISGYRLLDARFLPEYSYVTPLEKYVRRIKG